MKYLGYLMLLLGMVAMSCERSEIDDSSELDYKYGYYPLEIGNEWIYQVDSTIIITGGNDKVETFGYVRERVLDVVNTADGATEYRLERSFRRDTSEVWRITDHWLVGRDSSMAYKVEENLKLIKLVFPFRDRTSWDGNAFIDITADYPVGADMMDYYRGWEYIVLDDQLVYEQGDISISEVVQVQHIEADDDLIRRVFSEEYYAPGVGLVEKRFEAFEHSSGKSPGPWEDTAEIGISFHYRLVDYTVQ